MLMKSAEKRLRKLGALEDLSTEKGSDLVGYQVKIGRYTLQVYGRYENVDKFRVIRDDDSDAAKSDPYTRTYFRSMKHAIEYIQGVIRPPVSSEARFRGIEARRYAIRHNMDRSAAINKAIAKYSSSFDYEKNRAMVEEWYDVFEYSGLIERMEETK